jgi:uncharacterized protein (UPF0276 family)
MAPNKNPVLGFGLGLRPKHYQYIFEHQPKVDWFEIISENFMDTDGKPKRNLARIKERYPIVMHGVSMSIGSVDLLNSEYLIKLKKLIDWVNPEWVSDHLCWTGVAHKNTHDLLPLPYTEESLKHIIKRVRTVQEILERRIALENPSTYLEFKHSTIPEAEFIAAMAKETDCHLLLDVNNVYVSCFNHRLNPQAYLDALPLDQVIQIHLSGHSNKGNHIVDTHDDHVVDEVWNLYKYVVHRMGCVPNTMIEWDDRIPEFPVLYEELQKAKLAAQNNASYSLPLPLNRGHEEMHQNEMTLSKAQLLMQEAIMRGDQFDISPDKWIHTKEGFAANEQLMVYVNSYRYRLHDVVAEDYPALKHYLTEKPFHDLIWDFVSEMKPDHFNIGRFALKLPNFVQSAYPQNQFMHELCRLETTVAQMTDPLETEPLKESQIANLTAEKLLDARLYPREALVLMQFDYQVNEYYQAVMDENASVIPKLEKSYLAVFRHEDVVWRMSLEMGEFELLSKLFQGATIGESLSELTESDSQKITDYFSRWMRNGLLAAHEY